MHSNHFSIISIRFCSNRTKAGYPARFGALLCIGSTARTRRMLSGRFYSFSWANLKFVSCHFRTILFVRSLKPKPVLVSQIRYLFLPQFPFFRRCLHQLPPISDLTSVLVWLQHNQRCFEILVAIRLQTKGLWLYHRGNVDLKDGGYVFGMKMFPLFVGHLE